MLPLDGGPDILRAIYSKMIDNRRVARHGDCFFQMVEWDQNGKVSAESIHQFGSATLDETSVHYHDQAYLFSQMKMKPSWLELDSIKKYLKISYKP
jgi:penicillin amidase/acyl-homoserine-lactone acylase